MLDLGAEAILSVPVSSMSTYNEDVVLFTDIGRMCIGTNVAAAKSCPLGVRLSARSRDAR